MHNAHKMTAISRYKGFALVLTGLVAAGPAMGDVIYQQDFENWNNADGLWSLDTKADLGGAYSSVLGRFSATTVTLDVLATADNTAGLGGNGDGGSDSNPFNVTVSQFENNQFRIPLLDQGGGGGPGGGIGDITIDVPNLNLGGAIMNGTDPVNDEPPMFGAGTYSVHFDLMLFDSWDGDYAPYGPDTIAVAVNGQTLFDEIFFGELTERNFRPADETPEQNVYHTRWADNIYRDIEIAFELTEATDLLSIDFIGGPTQSILDESWGLDNVMIEQTSVARVVSAPEVPVPGTLLVLSGGVGLIARRKR